jgi:two-component system sensor histidine kinase SenX3
MGRAFGARTLAAICAVLVALLAALAIVQYRWSARVAAADAQREREYLDSAASLFANRFNETVRQAMEFLQNDAWAALRSGEQLGPLPKLISELYYLDIDALGPAQARRLAADGLFAPAPPPQWIEIPRCATLVIEQPPALVTPVYHTFPMEADGVDGIRMLQTFRGHLERCFVARIDKAYLCEALFPQLLEQSFGGTAVRDYEFAVVQRRRSRDALYGVSMRADLRKPFFSVAPAPLALAKPPLAGGPLSRRPLVLYRELATVVKGAAAAEDLFGPGIWELRVAHKGVPLDAAFERTRRRDLLMSLSVEALLAAAVIFLVIGARRMQRLADQKMRFVAGVSHELRTPVSAIAMLSRNQADGLAVGAERVKQYGELIHQQSRRLNQMVEQALQYAGIHSGLRRAAASEIDVRRLIEEAVDACREELARSGFEIEVAASVGLPPVWGDPNLLRTAIDNLLSNARKYADGGRWIRVSASFAAADKEVRISVEDRGPGIDPADQAEIFEPFCRGRAAIEAQIPGSGLGLSLVRSAVEAHRGAVTLASQPGRGCTFTLHLPV